jgi:3-deoxy-D-manno-octulosonic-acid transferase
MGVLILYSYRLLSLLFGCLVVPFLYYRLYLGKEDNNRISEKLGNYTTARPIGKKLIWINTASVGETLSVLPLINHLHEYNILLSTTTVTSAKLVKDKLPAHAIHVFVPIDTISVVRKFLNHWQPDLAILVESEWWPNIIIETSNVIPLISLNTRISDKSYQRWLKYKSVASILLARFKAFYPQSKYDEQKLQTLGASNIKMIGNLKYNTNLTIKEQLRTEVKQAIGNRQVFLAASTHNGEEEIVFHSYISLLKKHSNLLLIIAPRHPNRLPQIELLCNEHKLTYHVRSQGQLPDNNTKVYIVDTIGELHTIYSISDIAFVGGSLANIGGHNPLEPALLAVPMILGPYTSNFSDIIEELTELGIVKIVYSAEEMEKVVSDLLDGNSSMTPQLLSEARQHLEQRTKNIINTVEQEIQKLMDI